MTGHGRGRVALAWAAANLVLGYCAIFPLVSAVLFGKFVRANAWGILAGADHDPEPDIALGCFVTVGIPLAAASVVVNRALRRRLRAWWAAAFWTVTAAIQLVPFAFWTRHPDLTVPQMLGKGLLWRLPPGDPLRQWCASHGPFGSGATPSATAECLAASLPLRRGAA